MSCIPPGELPLPLLLGAGLCAGEAFAAGLRLSTAAIGVGCALLESTTPLALRCGRDVLLSCTPTYCNR